MAYRLLAQTGVDAPLISTDPKQGAMQGAPPTRSTSVVSFKWNGKHCEGRNLHVAVLDGDVAQVCTILEEDPKAIYLPFKYVHKKQEGSAEPIHLAASRGQLEVLKLLIEKRARLDAPVTRERKPYYYVLHAAIFAEGRGASVEIVHYLLEAKAQAIPNSDGQKPLELAWRTGNIDMIKAMKEEAIERCAEPDSAAEQAACLKWGIVSGKLKNKDLIAQASLSSQSLLTFMQCAPECVRDFIDRMKDAMQVKTSENSLDLSHANFAVLKAEVAHLHPSEVTKVVQVTELCSFLRFHKAADALLNFLAQGPREEEPSWHPMPAQVRFVAHGFFDALANILNPDTKNSLTTCQRETHWCFKLETQTAPDWHKEFLNEEHKIGEAVTAHIEVHFIPNLISAPFFNALCDLDTPDSMDLFENDTIKTAISYTFWEGAAILDAVAFTTSLWALALLLFESFNIYQLAMYSSVDLQNSKEALKEAENIIFIPSFYATSTQAVVAVSADWIMARAVQDLAREMAQLAGCLAMNQPSLYCNIGNLLDSLQGLLPLLLAFGMYDNRLLHVGIIFLSWFRLLNCMSLSENVALSLLPVSRMAKALLPAVAYTCVGFCAFTHAFFVIDPRVEAIWPGLLYRSFVTLITGGLPEEPDPDPYTLLLTVVAVVFFTVFFMNLFIGVISEKYVQAKALAPQSLWQLRANSCEGFLLASRCLPCSLMSKTKAACAIAAAILVALTVQIVSIVSRKALPGCFFIFVGCHMVMFVACFQSPGRPWASPHKAWSAEPTEPWYLWSIHKAGECETNALKAVENMIQKELEQHSKAMQWNFEKLAADLRRDMRGPRRTEISLSDPLAPYDQSPVGSNSGMPMRVRQSRPTGGAVSFT